jgi:hypothetical protein
VPTLPRRGAGASGRRSAEVRPANRRHWYVGCDHAPSSALFVRFRTPSAGADVPVPPASRCGSWVLLFYALCWWPARGGLRAAPRWASSGRSHSRPVWRVTAGEPPLGEAVALVSPHPQGAS